MWTLNLTFTYGGCLGHFPQKHVLFNIFPKQIINVKCLSAYITVQNNRLEDGNQGLDKCFMDDGINLDTCGAGMPES